MKPFSMALGPSRLSLVAAVLSLITLAPAPARAANFFWSDTNGGFFDSGTSWQGGTAPGATDSAIFTSNASYAVQFPGFTFITNANAFFNARGGVVTQQIGLIGSVWQLTNSYVVGQSNNTTSAVTHLSGTLRVTNSARTGRFVIGQGGRGTYNLRGGIVEADGLFVTNDGVGFTNSTFNFEHGTLITHTNSRINQHGDLLIGTTSNSSSVLQILGGTFTISNITGGVRIGNAINSTNQITVSGAGTLWTNNGTLTLGANGGENQLTVQSGADLFAAAFTVGGSPNSTSNRTTVTGVGSSLRASQVNVGNAGTDNLFLVTNGATVLSTQALLGGNSGATDNTAWLTGAGSAWTNTGEFQIGLSAGTNALVVSNGARLVSALGTFGFGSFAPGNLVAITGTNSVWENSGQVTLGNASGGNRLIVSNGGGLLSGGTVIGSTATSGSNIAVVNGTNSVWNNTSNLVLGSIGSGNTLIVSNGGRLLSGGTVLGSTATSSNNIAIVTGAGSVLTNAADLLIGDSGRGNQVIVSNGATLRSANATLGIGTLASGNSLLVTGSGSIWTNSGSVIVGASGSGNTLQILNNPSVTIAGGLIIGANASGSNNQVTVGPSALLNVSNVFVGSNGPNNQFVLQGILSADTVLVGVNASSTNNSLTVTNGQLFGTSASSRLDLRRGAFQFDGGNISLPTFLITNNTAAATNATFTFNSGGLDTQTDARIALHGPFVIGNTPGALARWTAQSATVAVTNLSGGATVLGGATNSRGSLELFTVTTFTNTGTLIIGSNGAANLLLVSNSSSAGIGRDLIVGTGVASVSNRVIVDNSALTVGGHLALGNLGASNLLLLTNAATLNVASNLDVGINTNSRGNVLAANGAGSVVTIGNSLTLGINGDFNQLLITGGARVVDSNGFVGGSLGRSNFVLVSGSNSVWSNLNVLQVGNSGGSGDLVVSNGGRVFAGAATLGSGSSNNTATVTGTNSVWSNQFTLTVGATTFGNSNQLRVLAGAMVVSSNGLIGAASGGSDNLVLISGAGSAWSNLAVVQLRNDRNTLVVSNGGSFASANLDIGGSISTGSNRVVVTGSNSVVRAAGVSVGSFAPANDLTISDGGKVFASTFGRLGASVAGASNNTALVTGAGSLWSNATDLLVGVNSGGNTLTLSNSGAAIAGQNVTISSSAGAANNILNVFGGTLTATNPVSSLGILDVGQAGRGTLNFSGGSIAVSSLRVTNNGVGFTNSIFNFNHGTLTTLSNSTIVANGTASLSIGKTPGQTAIWRALGGVNTVIGAVDLGDGTLRTGQLIVTGPGTVWSNTLGLRVGFGGTNSQLIVSNGAVLSVPLSIGVGAGNASSSNNLFVVHGTGSRVTADSLDVGVFGADNHAIIAAGAAVITDSASIGQASSARSNSVLVTGPDTLWTNVSNLGIGSGADNQLTVADGARLFIGGAANVGSAATASNNAVLVTGSGSLLSNVGGLVIGGFGSGNSLTVVSNGVVTADTFTAGASAGASSNVITVDGGELRGNGTNGSGAVLTAGRIGQGTVNLLSGSITASSLRVTNGALSQFNFAGGTLNVFNSTVSNGAIFVVGNDTAAATLNLLGNGTHSFANNLTLSSNATLTGNGRIIGTVNSAAATIRPGSSAGALQIDGTLIFGSAASVVFEIGGLIPTNQYDQITVTDFVNYAGTLSLALINNFLPDDSDTFTLFKTGTSGGTFNNAPIAGRVNLTNNLASFAVTYSGTNLVLGDAKYVDTDGDGQGDLQEQAAGTDAADPLNALAIVSITQTNGGAQVLVDFQSVPGKNYRVEYTTNLSTGVWTPIFSPPLNALATNRSRFTDDGSLTGGLPVTRRFYRVGLGP